jgi:phosphatidylserine/phosphatidylglycerophosphate/cardiolipin synthase-like enzyme
MTGPAALPMIVWVHRLAVALLWASTLALLAATSHEATVLVSAVFYDGYAPRDLDEAVQIWNVGGADAEIGGWFITDGEGTASFPLGARLHAGDYAWLARDAEAFRLSFGHGPDWAWGRADAGVPRMATANGGPVLANVGDQVALRRPDGSAADVAVYGAASAEGGWEGSALRPYAGGVIRASHQVLFRKLLPDSAQPVRDTDSATDWASDHADPVLGRRARFPGWDVEQRWIPERVAGRGKLELAVAPDALLSFLRRHLGSARRSIDMAVYTIEHPDVAETIVGRLRSGVRVRILVDGSPVGGVDMNQRWCLARIVEAGGEVYWHDDGGDVRARYRSAHAKLAVIDDETVLIGSENPSLGAAPGDDQSNGISGRRGVFAATDVPAVVAWASELLSSDMDASRHADVRPFQSRDPKRGAPPRDFEPERGTDGSAYEPLFSEPLVITGTFAFELVSAPENALHPGAGPVGLVARAGAGDEVLSQQMREPLWWGDGPAEGEAAMSPRVRAYMDAARRGARVRVLLDSYFDDPDHWNANLVAVNALNAAAHEEGLDLEARLGNPAGLGLHNKMILVRSHARMPSAGLRSPRPDHRQQSAFTAHLVHVGSLNGSEVASKVNREAAIQVESEAAHRYLLRVFEVDWARAHRYSVSIPIAQR